MRRSKTSKHLIPARPVLVLTRSPGARVTGEFIARRIVEIRGVRVLADSDLAALYGVTTKALNQAVTRNRARFPGDFMLRLTSAETQNLRSQIVTSSLHGGRRHSAHAFTEQGVAMLSSVLRSRRAIVANIAVMRAFVEHRGVVASHKVLVRRLDDLEGRYDKQFAAVFKAIRELLTPLEPPRRRIGFVSEKESSRRARRHSVSGVCVAFQGKPDRIFGITAAVHPQRSSVR